MGSNFNPPDNIARELPPPQGYALSGKIMLSAIVILFVVVVFMVCLHLYARWYLLRARRRQLLRRSRRRTQIVFYVDPNNNAAAPIQGLDASVLGSLPIFVYSSKTHPEEVLECAVCLSEFEENEKGRLLPKCNHRFHTECIDMWFHSHSTCPICRSPVEPQILAPVIENRSDLVISVGEPVDSEPGSSSGMCSSCQHDDEVVSMASSSSSVGARRKGLDLVRVTVEVPRRNESQDELRTSSPASQGFRSPGSRLLSLKRILSMNRRSSSSAVSPSSGVGTSCGAQTQSSEFDIELGKDESTQALTPR